MKGLLLFAILSIGIVNAQASEEVCGFLYYDKMTNSYDLQDYVKSCYYSIEPSALSAPDNVTLRKQVKSAEELRATATACFVVKAKGNPCSDTYANITRVEKIKYLGFEFGGQ